MKDLVFLSTSMLLFFFFLNNLSYSQDILITDYQVNDNGGHSRQQSPDIAVDGSGNFICVWEDNRDESSGDLDGFFGYPGGDIYARILNPSGELIGNSFKVNNDETTFWQQLPVVAAAGNGSFVVAWLDERESTQDENIQNIYAQRFDSDGTPLGTNFRVNEADGVSWMEKPAIAADVAGNFIIVWSAEGSDEAEYELYAQRYLADGSTVDGNFVVSNFHGRNESRHPSIAMNSSGEFIIAFEGIPGGDNPPNIYVQKFTTDASPQDTNIVVDYQPVEDTQVGNPLAGIDDAGNFIVIWKDSRLGYYDVAIFGQWFDSDGNPLGSNFQITGLDVLLSQGDLDIELLTGSDGSYTILWKNYNDEKFYAGRFSGDSTSAGNPFAVSDEMFGHYPTAAMQNNNNFLVAWTKGTEPWLEGPDLSDINGQYIQGDSSRLEQDLGISDDEGAGNQLYSDISVKQNNDYVIVWEDRKEDNGDIWLKRFTSAGMAMGEQVRVNDDEPGQKNINPAIATDSSGLTLVVWQDYRPPYQSSPKVIGQFYSADGQAIDTNFVINSAFDAQYFYPPSVATLGNNRFVVTWSYQFDIVGQIYSADSGAVGDGFYVNDVRGDNVSRFKPAVAADDNGKFIIVWEDRRSGTDIYAQLYDRDGEATGGNIKVNDFENWGLEPATAFTSEGDIYVAWQANGIYFQHISKEDSLVGANILISDLASADQVQLNTDISFNNDSCGVITWEVINYHTYLSSGIYGVRLSSSGTVMDSVFQISGTEAHSPTEAHLRYNNKRIYTTWTDNQHAGTGWDVYANVIDFGTPDTVSVIRNNNPVNKFQLYQNYPNPFNPVTHIVYHLGKKGPVKLEVYTILGQKLVTLVDKTENAGKHKITWNAKGIPSGVYFYKLKSNEGTEAKKLLLMK